MSLQALVPVLLRPQALWLLLLLLPLCWWHYRRSDGLKHLISVVDTHLLPAQLVPARQRRAGRWRLPLAWLLGCCALAGPSWGVSPQAVGSSRDGLVLAVELSSALYQDDVAPSRLLRLRSKLAELLAARVEGETALLVYAGDAYEVVPLTEDSANIALYLDALAPTVMPEDGQRADLAIARAAALLQGNGLAHGHILLLATDADAAAVRAAATARAQGWRVSVLAVRADGIGAGLTALASAGGGRARAIALDQADLRGLGLLTPVAGTDLPAGQEAPGTRTLRRDDGFWLLPLVLLLLLPSLQRGALVAVLALTAVSGLGARVRDLFGDTGAVLETAAATGPAPAALAG